MTPAQPLNTQLLFTLTGRVGAPSEIGVLPQGRRRIIPIEGGAFEGPRIRGQVLPFGADGPTEWPSSTSERRCGPTTMR